MGQKRKRLALSCVDCRRRKVKCDRTYPVCVRCQKSNNAEHCLYVPHTGLEPGLPTPSEDSPQQQQPPPSQVASSGEPYVLAALREMSPHMEVQSRQPLPQSKPPQQDINSGMMHTFFGRAAQLEVYTRNAGSKPVAAGLFADPENIADVDANDKDNRASDFGNVMVRGKNFSTHYYGPSFAISMLLQFEELSRFVKDILNKVPSLAGLKEKMNALRNTAKKQKRKGVFHDQSDLIAMVPDRRIADRLVEQYLDVFETTYRIIHVPTFQRDYEAYWQDPTAAKPEFLVILLLMMACVYHVVPGGLVGFVGRSSACRDVASQWVVVCESWLEEQSQKHVRLPHFQAHTLVFAAKAMNCIKIKREWTGSGQLLRFAMAIGMHREPSLLSKRINTFDQEMRRRLWYTIVELDLLTTIARGMPPTIDSFSWDCLPPRNIDDEDFDEDTEQLPPSKPRSTFTRSSFLHLATESLPLRIEALGRINSVRLGLDLDAVMQYDSKLRGLIDDLPPWKGDNSQVLAKQLSTLVLYDFILILHVPFATQTQNKAKSFYSVASKRDISFKTLRIYAQMSDQERLILTDIRDDACRATLALSHDMTTHMHSEVVPNHEQALAYMETVIDTFAKRFHLLGQGFHTYWIALSAYNLLRWKVSPSPSAEQFAQEAADKVTGVFQYILAHQVSAPLPNGDIPAAGTDNAENTPSMTNSLGSYDTTFAVNDQMNFFGDPFSEMNFDLSMWNFEIPNFSDMYNI